MLSLRTVTPDTLELLKALMSAPELSSLRLVGGTALALQYGHRVSVDLDLFLRSLLKHLLKQTAITMFR